MVTAYTSFSASTKLNRTINLGSGRAKEYYSISMIVMKIYESICSRFLFRPIRKGRRYGEINLLNKNTLNAHGRFVGANRSTWKGPGSCEGITTDDRRWHIIYGIEGDSFVCSSTFGRIVGISALHLKSCRETEWSSNHNKISIPNVDTVLLPFTIGFLVVNNAVVGVIIYFRATEGFFNRIEK